MTLEYAAIALFVIGLLIVVVGYLWLAVLAMEISVLWGLGSLFVPFVNLVFSIMYWDRARKPFFVWIAGHLLLVPAVIMWDASHPPRF